MRREARSPAEAHRSSTTDNPERITPGFGGGVYFPTGNGFIVLQVKGSE
jgi:hypothetical protein